MSGLPQPSPLLRWLKYSAFKIDSMLRDSGLAIDDAAKGGFRAYDEELYRSLAFLHKAAQDAQVMCSRKVREESQRCILPAEAACDFDGFDPPADATFNGTNYVRS